MLAIEGTTVSTEGNTKKKIPMSSIKLSSKACESARIVAAYRGVTQAELMAEILEPALAKMEREERTKRDKAQAEADKAQAKK